MRIIDPEVNFPEKSSIYYVAFRYQLFCANNIRRPVTRCSLRDVRTNYSKLRFTFIFNHFFLFHVFYDVPWKREQGQIYQTEQSSKLKPDIIINMRDPTWRHAPGFTRCVILIITALMNLWANVEQHFNLITCRLVLKCVVFWSPLRLVTFAEIGLKDCNSYQIS